MRRNGLVVRLLSRHRARPAPQRHHRDVQGSKRRLSTRMAGAGGKLHRGGLRGMARAARLDYVEAPHARSCSAAADATIRRCCPVLLRGGDHQSVARVPHPRGAPPQFIFWRSFLIARGGPARTPRRSVALHRSGGLGRLIGQTGFRTPKISARNDRHD